MSDGHPQRLGLERTFPSELSACKKPRAPRASVSLGAPSAKGMGTPEQELRKSREQPVLCSDRRSPNVPQRHDLRPPPQKPPASARQTGRGTSNCRRVTSEPQEWRLDTQTTSGATPLP